MSLRLLPTHVTGFKDLVVMGNYYHSGIIAQGQMPDNLNKATLVRAKFLFISDQPKTHPPSIPFLPSL
jgi:hypothetical protein